jgi:integrase/recombinase XerC
MTSPSSTSPNWAELDAAVLPLSRRGYPADDLLVAAPAPPASPTFAEYIPIVSAAVGASIRRVYGSYWKQINDHWGDRVLDEASPSEIKALVEQVRANVVVRRNARGGRSAAEHLIAALQGLYRNAADDGHVNAVDNPARMVAKPPAPQRSVAI